MYRPLLLDHIKNKFYGNIWLSSCGYTNVNTQVDTEHQEWDLFPANLLTEARWLEYVA